MSNETIKKLVRAFDALTTGKKAEKSLALQRRTGESGDAFSLQIRYIP